MNFDIEPESDELEPYRIRSHQEILTLLRSLTERSQLLNMNFDGDAGSLMTAILKVEEAEGRLIVSGAQDALTNERIADSGEVRFETLLNHVPIMFSVERVTLCAYQNSPALSMAQPDSLIRMQRREDFRVAIPVMAPVRCTIRIPHENGRGVSLVELALHNVSGGGIAIIDEAMALDDTVGRIYRECQIDVPGVSRIVTNLQIRNSCQVRLASGRTVRRLGCMFLNLPRPMLEALQRYTLKLEHEQNAHMDRLG